MSDFPSYIQCPECHLVNDHSLSCSRNPDSPVAKLEARVAALENRIAVLEGRRVQSSTDGFKLCYVDHGMAWFTTNELAKQWGDDWNDAPYEHNAGSPYDWQSYMQEKHGVAPYKLFCIRYEGMETPADRAYSGNSQYAVDDINSGAVAWLSANGINIFAGTSIEEFKQKVRAAGGTVYKEDNDGTN